jgi:hypothetical protein
MNGDEKVKCPMCAEEVPADSELCPYCGSELHPAPEQSETAAQAAPPPAPPVAVEKKKKRGKKVAGVIVGIVLTASLAAAAAVFGIISYNNAKAESDFKKSVRQANTECKDIMFKFTKTSKETADKTHFGRVSEAAFVELGNSIADTYIPVNQQYYNEMVALMERVKQYKVPDDYKDCHAQLLSGLDIYGRAILQQVAALDMFHNTNLEKWNQACDASRAVNTTLNQGNDTMNQALSSLTHD